MTEREPLSAPDHLEAAIEASCETLVALQVISEAAPDDDRLNRQARRAIRSLRRAIHELRTERSERASALAFGFVVGGPSAPPRKP